MKKQPPHPPKGGLSHPLWKEFKCLTIIGILIVYCLLLPHLGGGGASAQTMVLGVDRGRDSVVSEWGPNMKKHLCVFLSGGFAASGDEAGARIKYFSSGEIMFGLRMKYKISPVYSLGWELFFHQQYFKLKQEEGKVLPDTILHDVERFDIGGLGTSFYNRFNFDPQRGNFLGRFLDLGISGQWNSSFAHITKDDLPDGTKIKVAQTQLPYENNFSSDVYVRLGISKISLYARYRLTDIFKPYTISGYGNMQYYQRELPRLMLGLDFTIFRE